MPTTYLGPKGTFSHQAAILYQKGERESGPLTPVVNLTDIVASLENQDGSAGWAQKGVIPFENSTNGHVVPTLDLFKSMTHVFVVDEVYLDVHHSLLSMAESLSDIKRIYSHPQAFGQCERYLKAHLPGVERVNVSSTGHAAQLASTDAESCAIASSLSAEFSRVRVMQASIEDKQDNTTRFFVLAREPAPYRPQGQKYKTLIRFSVPHTKPGSLADTLQLFAQASINLTSIAPRPNGQAGKKWVYLFLLEFSGHFEQEHIQSVLTAIREKGYVDQLHVLGSFLDVRKDDSVEAK